VSAYVTTAWLEEHLGDANLRIVEASIAKESYDSAHVPGAVWVDAHRDLLHKGDDSSGDVLSPEEFARLVRRLGIAPETTVVWYGDRQSSFAIRGLWTLDFYRHPGGVHLLEGGRERWLAEKRRVTRDATVVSPADYPTPAASNEENRATWPEVRDAIGSRDKVVLDVRSVEEYDGRSVRAAHGGHIPGAVHVEWTDATAGENTLRRGDELRAMYASRGVTPDKEIIAHCQLGIRAVHTWFVLKHVLGYPHVKNYDGSWQEWGNRDDLPIEV
jgi:thiosulfate/3-mercaptopyruvate sulfurtransferase